MTDGQDNRSQNLSSKLAELQACVREGRQRVQFHCIGFTEGHNRDLLERLRKVGSLEGVYRYAQGADLEQRFTELFDFLQVAAKVELEVDGRVVQCDAVRGE